MEIDPVTMNDVGVREQLGDGHGGEGVQCCAVSSTWVGADRKRVQFAGDFGILARNHHGAVAGRDERAIQGRGDLFGAADGVRADRGERERNREDGQRARQGLSGNKTAAL